MSTFVVISVWDLSQSRAAWKKKKKKTEEGSQNILFSLNLVVVDFLLPSASLFFAFSFFADVSP